MGPNSRLTDDHVEMSVRDRLVKVTIGTKQKVPTLLPGMQSSNGFGVERFVDVIIGADVLRRSLLTPVVIAVGFIEIIALSNGDVLVAIDERVFMTIMNDGVAS